MNVRIARRIAPILWAPLLVLVAACDGESATGPGQSLTGTWTLSQVNGSAVPFTVLETPASKLEVLSGSIALRSGSRFSSRVTWRETVNGVATVTAETVAGRFTVSGRTILMTVTGETQPSTTAVLSDTNARITIVDDGVTFLFQRTAAAPPPDEA